MLISNNSKTEELGFVLAFVEIAGLILITADMASMARSVYKTSTTIAGIIDGA